MEDRKADRPKSNVFTRIVNTFIKPNQKEPEEPSEDEIANRRGKGIFNSLRKKLKPNRSKQKVVASERRSCHDGFRETDMGSDVILKSASAEQFDNNDNSPYINRQDNIFLSNGVIESSSRTSEDTNNRSLERNEINSMSSGAPPVPPRRTIITSRTRDTLDEEDEASSQYLDVNDLNQEGNSSQNNSPSRTSECSKSLVTEQFNLAKHGWFWGPLSRQETENNLRNQPDGSFLVRESRSVQYIYTLSFRCYGQTMHSHIEYSQGKFLMGEHLSRSTVSELIEEAIAISKESVFSYSRSRNEADPGYPVRLTRPVSRFMEVRSLQYLSRFVIRQYINVNNIQKLPLPNSLKGYLHQTQY